MPNLSTDLLFLVDRAKWANYIWLMAKVYNMHDAKSNLSRLIEEVLAGESVTIARAGLPLVDLTPHAPRKPQPGFMSHLIVSNMTDDEEQAFFAPEPWDPWAGEDATKW